MILKERYHYIKRIAALQIAVMMMLSIVACMEPTGGVTEESKITIRFEWWGTDNRNEYTQELLDLYTKLHPNIVFEANPTGWDGYFDRLSTQAATGAMPDIVQMDYMYLNTYSKNNSLADMTKYIEDGTIDTSNIGVDVMNMGVVDGELTGMVCSTTTMAVGYNMSVLNDAGVNLPTKDWTWEDFVNMSAEVTKVTEKAGAVVSSGAVGNTTLLNYWVRQHGEQLYSDDGTELGFTDESIIAGYLDLWNNMINNNLYPDPDEFAQIESLGQSGGPVATGEAAFCFDWDNYATSVAEYNDTIGMITPPLAEGSDNQALWVKPGQLLSISEKSTVKKEAAEFINWFINSEEANYIINAERGIPVSSKIRDVLLESGNLSKQQAEMFHYTEKEKNLIGTVVAPEPCGIMEINKLFMNAGNSVFHGQQTAQEAAREFMEAANKVLAKNKPKKYK